MRRILIVRLTSLGDVILVTPLLTHLRTVEPTATVGLMTDRRYAGLFAADPRIDELYPIPSLPSMKQLPRNWDLIVDLQNSRKSRALLRNREHGSVTTKLDKLHVKRMVLLLTRLNLYRKREHICARYLSAAGYSSEGAPIPPVRLYPQDFLKSTILDRQDGPLLALAPFAAWKNKQWPLENYTLVAKHFINRGWKVFLFGSKDEAQQAGQLKRSVGEGCHNLAGELSLPEVAASLSVCHLALGNDSGLSHLARACGVKTGIIYGSTSWHWGFYPHGSPAYTTIERSMFCRPCHPHGGDHCWRGGRPCLTRISPSQVIEALERLQEQPLLTIPG